MFRPALTALCALALLACNKGETPADDPPAPTPAAEKAADRVADKPADAPKPAPSAEEMAGGDDRPMILGCGDCLTRVETAGLVLDTAKIDHKGATPTAARLDLTISGQTVKLPVAQANLGKADVTLENSLDGLPEAKDCTKWSAAKATLEVDYTTSLGKKETRLQAVPVEVPGCK